MLSDRARLRWWCGRNLLLLLIRRGPESLHELFGARRVAHVVQVRHRLVAPHPLQRRRAELTHLILPLLRRRLAPRALLPRAVPADETRPLTTGLWTRRVHLVRGWPCRLRALGGRRGLPALQLLGLRVAPVLGHIVEAERVRLLHTRGRANSPTAVTEDSPAEVAGGNFSAAA
mgnify:CR=1 FL=1